MRWSPPTRCSARSIPSVSARSGGILFPITRSLAETLGSTPGPDARQRLGGFLLPVVYHCDVIVCAMFLTGQASNPLIASFARQAAGIDLDLRDVGARRGRAGRDRACC